MPRTDPKNFFNEEDQNFVDPQHAEYSPSALAKLSLCPKFKGNPLDIHGNPIPQEFISNEAAESGTRCHNAMSFGTDDELIGDELEVVKTTRIALDSYEREFGDGHIYNEVRINITSKNDLLKTHGYADRVKFSNDGTKALLTDFKFGREPVPDVLENTQMGAYALGLFQMFPVLETVQGLLLCPNMISEYNTSSGTFTRSAHVPYMEAKLADILAACEDPNSKPTPNPDACQHCKVKATCPALKETALTVAKNVSGLPLPETFEPANILSVRDRVLAQIIAIILEDWAGQVKKFNTAAVFEQDMDLGFFNRVSRSGGYKINDADQMIAIAAERFQINPSDLRSLTTLSFSKLISGLRELGVKNPAQEIREDLIESGILAGILEEKQPVRFLQKKRGTNFEEVLKELPPGN